MSGGVLTLSLKNFRCWENKTFTFQDNGIVLISGISGKGKSTLLNAILFVIFPNLFFLCDDKSEQIFEQTFEFT